MTFDQFMSFCTFLVAFAALIITCVKNSNKK